MTREMKGHYDGSRLQIGIALATFNAVITDGLLEGVRAALADCSVTEITLLRVPGALELPLAARKLIAAGVDAVVAVGAVIEGETDHYVHVAGQAMSGLQQVGLEAGVPVSNAVLTVREFSHARDRSLPGKANKGYEAGLAAVFTANAFGEFD